MKEIGPIAGIDCKNTTKMIIKERIIVLFRTIEIGENIKIIVRTNIGMKSSTIEIYLMIEMSHIVEIDCEAITENLKTRDTREGLKTIIKTGTARIIIEIVTKQT